MKTALVNISFLLLFCYLGASILLYVFQRDFLYFPTEKYAHTYVCYTGIAEQDIMINTVFEYLQDSKEPNSMVEGSFELDSIILMSKNSDIIPKGYNALVFVGSTVGLEEIKKNIKFNDKGNFEHVCILG